MSEVPEGLVKSPEGYLVERTKAWVAYCPVCFMAMHPMYFHKHTEEECLEYALETIEEIQTE